MKVINEYPETYHVFILYGIHCFTCAFSSFETIEQGAEAHNIDVDELLKALNEKIKQVKQEEQNKKSEEEVKKATEI